MVFAKGVLFMILISRTLFADTLLINSVKINGEFINVSDFKSIKIDNVSTVEFYYKANADGKSPSDFIYKSFLNGALIPSDISDKNSPRTIISRLNEGVYIFKAQCSTLDGWEINSRAVQLEVFPAEGIIESAENRGGRSGDNILLWIAIIELIMIVLLILALFSIKMKKASSSIFNTFVSGHKDVFSKKLKLIEGENDFLKKQLDELKQLSQELRKKNEELKRQNEKLKKSKRQLEELQAEKEKLFAITIHDIKNPASAIKGYVDLLNRYDLNAIEQHEILESLAASSMYIINLSHKMTKALSAKSKDETEVIEFKVGSLKKAIDGSCKRNFAKAKMKDITIINNASPHVPEIRIDEFKIGEALDNYIGNAIKYCPNGSTVKVSSYFSETKATVEVTDNGPGLPESDLSKAFQKGRTLSAKPTGGEYGSGHGLWIVKNIIESHGGGVWVKSKLGVGSTFGFDLPLKFD